MRIFVLTLFFITNNVYAEWLCKTTSSLAQNSTFYACGHATEKSLSKAREEALKSAKREFKSFCRDSENCNGFSYILKPLRTDCSKEGDNFSCFRALEYNILPHKKTSLSNHSLEMKILINEKEKELQNLKRSALESSQLNELEQEILKYKKQDHSELDNFINLSLQLMNLPFKEKVEALGGIGLGYEKAINSHYSLTSSFSYILNEKDKKLPTRGRPNEESKNRYHDYKGYNLELGLPVSLSKAKIIPYIGYVHVNYQSIQHIFNEYGVGLKKRERLHSYSSLYYGLDYHFGEILYFQMGPRFLIKNEEFGFNVSTGINVSF